MDAATKATPGPQGQPAHDDATGVYPNGLVPLWFKAAWGLAAMAALALMERKPENRLVLRGLHPAIQLLIAVVITAAALPDLRRNARRDVELCYTWERVAARTAELYGEVIRCCRDTRTS